MPVYLHNIYSNYAAHYATVHVCSLGSANWAEPGPGGLKPGVRHGLTITFLSIEPLCRPHLINQDINAAVLCRPIT